MKKQNIAIVKLSEEEHQIANKGKTNPAKCWTHKVVCGEHATFLQIGDDPGLATMVIKNWPHVFGHIDEKPPSNAKPVEQADRKFLITLEKKFGDPTERKIKEAEESMRQILQSPPKQGFWSRIFGGK